MIIPVGVPRKPAMTKDDFFNINADMLGRSKGISKCYMKAIVHMAPFGTGINVTCWHQTFGAVRNFKVFVKL